LPENKCKNLTDDFELTSSKKGIKRYWTNEIKSMLAELTDAENRREQALKDSMKSLFKSFDNQ
jgi:DNA mismatch repair protein MSH6